MLVVKFLVTRHLYTAITVAYEQVQM